MCENQQKQEKFSILNHYHHQPSVLFTIGDMVHRENHSVQTYLGVTLLNVMRKNHADRTALLETVIVRLIKK